MVSVKDYTENHSDALELKKKLEQYYHQRGFDWVKVWLEPEIQMSGRKFWNIRSNITFNCDSIR